MSSKEKFTKKYPSKTKVKREKMRMCWEKIAKKKEDTIEIVVGIVEKIIIVFNIFQHLLDS